MVIPSNQISINDVNKTKNRPLNTHRTTGPRIGELDEYHDICNYPAIQRPLPHVQDTNIRT